VPQKRSLRGLQPVASPGDVIHNGEYFVCRVDVPKGHVYDAEGSLLSGVDLLRYKGALYTDQRDPAEYKGVRNWFMGSRDKQRFGLVMNEGQELRNKVWLENYEANRSLISRPATDVPQSDVVYLVASGPSLESNVPALLDIKRGVKVAVNWTLAWCAEMGFGPDLFDYFACIDYHIKPLEHQEYPNVVGVFDVVVNPSVPRLGFKDRLWFTSDAQDGNPAAMKAQAENVGLPEYDAGLNVTFSILQWAIFALGAKTVVLVGADCALTYGRFHCGTWAKYDFWHPAEFTVLPDIYGRPVVSVKNLVDVADWTLGAFYFMRENGIRVINATEGGLLSQHCELKPLEETVAELNEGDGDGLSDEQPDRGVDVAEGQESRPACA